MKYKELKRYVKQCDKIKAKSKIFCIIRNYDGRKYYPISNDELMLNGGMSVMGYDSIFSYMCKIFDYEITFYAGTKECSVYKLKWDCDGGKGRKVPINLHYYYYKTKNAPDIFKDEEIEQIGQEDLCKLANKNWANCKEFIKTKRNAAFLKEMKYKYIKYMEYNKQIIYSKKEKKYIPYNHVEFCESEGYSW